MLVVRDTLADLIHCRLQLCSSRARALLHPGKGVGLLLQALDVDVKLIKEALFHRAGPKV